MFLFSVCFFLTLLTKLGAMNRIYILAICFMCAFISANAQVRVVDALDSMPVSAASAFDAKGNMVGYTKGDGVLSEIKASAYPITLRCMGYEQLVIGRKGQFRC